ncbi:hypothetical protein HDU91_003965 [Kappamyces sp. JEL0680]|nr:hypothetical protein HDU91_003965 [Kappamyces sp. JEL0680]
MAGLRQSRQKTRKEEQEREEARKRAIDEGFRQDAEARRLAACDRAKRLQYMQSDEVKAFHSQLSLLQVCEEREMQIKLKKTRQGAQTAADEALVISSLQKCRELEKEEAEMKLLKRLERVQLAQVHVAQAKLRRLNEHEEKKNELKYGHYLAAQDKAHNQEQKNLAHKKRQDELGRKKVLEDMRQLARDRKVWEKLEAEEEDRTTQAWARHQERKAQLKAEIEEEWKKKSLKIRTEIGETLHKQAVDATLKEREIREEQQRQADAKVLSPGTLTFKVKEEAEARALKKKLNFQELKAFHELHQARRKEEHEKEARTGKEELARFKKDARAWEEEVAQKKALTKKIESEITNYNRTQTVGATVSCQLARERQKQKERQEELNGTATLASANQEKQTQLKEYMKSVSEEIWASRNPRIQSFIKHAASGIDAKPKHAKPGEKAAQKSDTHARIGFVGHSYDKIDLAGSLDQLTLRDQRNLPRLQCRL